ncbi:MAG: hypothetical protein A2W93_07790 [Bacteroidetes bacterium GWF2_43_63]|nr:MAG: hypothetical protein A2W94_09645 [Bacteroidetes bacterium GWE2_42_42]OFY53070.1 MAG: hypothetical protein A2W93_07790 [Bacteroidetes bacterium GWF2_43_63]HBG69166.1 hypothetical protein [Bacteroidales bacterium]HCB62563.1 hypothetical protein [Bacteroidales bacterium]
MKSSIIIAGVVAIASAALIYNFVSSDSDNFVSNHKNQLPNSSQENSKTEEYEAEVLAPTGLSKLVYESQNINTGVIGIDAETNIDDPHDNTFIVYLDGDVESGRQAWLEYDLYGAEDFTSVSRTINDQIAVGGAFIKLSQEWSVQREKIDASQLHKGDNIVRFSIPGNQDFNYTVKNVRIRFDESVDMSRKIVLNQPMSKSYYNRYGYISGFVSGNGSENAKIYANGKLVRSNQAIFEGIVDQIASNGSDWEAVVTAVFADGQIISDTARFCNPATCDFSNEITPDIAYNETLVTAQMPVHMNIPGFELNGEPGSVTTKVKMSVTGLRSQDMALPRLSMVNVTGASNGFRCLPHGNLFAKEVEVRIKYDTARIPQGYGPKDIRTFYYDESQNDWVMLPYDTVDIASCEIVSHTNHFTDFINAILKTPESPQTQAFTPTSMKDMKYADPIAHINMMSPPQANNSGTANLSLPIQVPAGRQGMQPQLAITYNSEGGNGWLGVGWGMNTPSISIDTRWGVPLYSSSFETEEYFVNGQQIIQLEISANDTTRDTVLHMSRSRVRASGDINFSYRVEGAFDKIIRHGSSPSTYWWEVIDKQGTQYYYGKYSSDPGVNLNCVLRQPGTNSIAHWALAEVRDLYGNYVKYNYQIVTHSGTPGSGGKQIYPQSIVYTGFGNTDGLYSVNFVYDAGRDDYQISGRYGFLEVTDRLLSHINISFDGQYIRSYGIKYKTGAYNKNLICAIADITDSTQHGVTKQETCETLDTMHIPGVKVHTFQYYEEEGLEFRSVIDTLFTQPEYSETLFEGDYIDTETQGIGRSKGTTTGIGGSISLGLGTNILSKSNSIGLNINTSVGTLKEKIQILDINGDGIPDKLERNGNSYNLYKGSLDSNKELVFSTTPHNLNTLPNLGRNWNYSRGIGAEIQANLPSINGSASISKNWTDQYTSSYFADINADGYIDYVDDNKIYFNKPNTSNNPVFYEEDGNIIQYFPDDECYFIIHDGEIDSSFNEYNDVDSTMIRRDPVRLWIVQDRGEIVINSSLQRAAPNPAHNTPIHYSIQWNDSVILCETISAHDTLTHDTSLCITTAEKGDRFFFRMHSDEMHGLDDVSWDPVIYSHKGNNCLPPTNDFKDANDKSFYKYQYSTDGFVNDEQFFIAPLSGKVLVKGNISSPAQSDSLNFMIKHNQTVLMDVVYPDTSAFDTTFYYDLNVNEGDSVIIKLASSSNVNWNDIMYDGKVQYYEADSVMIDTLSQYQSIDIYPSLQTTIYPNRMRKTGWKNLSSGTHIFYPALQYSVPASANGTVTFTAKTKRDLVAKKTLEIQNGQIVGTPSANKLMFTLNTTDTVFFDYSATDSVLRDIYAAQIIDSVTSLPSGAGYHTTFPDEIKMIGSLYRGWGQFSYYDNTGLHDCFIDESLLYLDTTGIYSNLSTFPLSQIDTNMTFDQVENLFQSNGIPDIYSMSFVPMIADNKDHRWVDFFKSAYVELGNMGCAYGIDYLMSTTYDTSVFEEDDFPFPGINDPLVMVNSSGNSLTVKKQSRQIDKSFSYSFGNPTFSISTTKSETESRCLLDFMDVNGDRYPDVVGYDKIQYSNPQGGISINSIALSGIYPSHGTGTAVGHSFGLKTEGFRNSNTSGSSKSKHGNLDGSFGIGTTNSNSNVDYIYSDINGDGLNDRIDKSNNVVYLGLGYGFFSGEAWTVNNISASCSNSTSLSAGFNLSQYSWSLGIGGSNNKSYDNYSMMDINNDGLTDVCYISGNSLKAYVNTGNGFTNETLDAGFGNKLSKTSSNNIGANISATAGMSFLFGKLVFSGYGDVSYNISSSKYRLCDMNGNNTLDFVFVEDGMIKVKYGVPKKVNMLKKVTTPTKSSYTMDYAMTYPTRNNPQSKWVYSSLMVYDGFNGDGQNTTYYKYAYDSAFYHRMERESFGFEIVRTMQYDNFSSSGICYRTSEEKYHNDYYLFKGLKKYDVSKQGIHKYVETYYVWDRKEISTGRIIPADSAQCFGPYYPAISQEDKYFYEGQSAYQIHTRKTYRHTRFGNVREYKNYGDVAYTSDDFTATITYSYNIPSNLLAMVNQIDVQDVSNNLLQRRTGSYNGVGRISSIGSFDGANTAYTDIDYDSYGNISSILFPKNVNNERLSYTYKYDPVVHTYPVSVTDYWGNSSSTVYDYKLGAPLIVIDMTGNRMHYSYYADGKLNTVTGPNEVLAGIPFTIKCEYWDEAGGSAATRWARTRHYDPINANNEFVTVNFSDGLGRSIQLKQKATVEGVDLMVVSGRTDYDAYGRAYRTSLPTDQALGTEIIFYNYAPTNFASTTFDLLDRPLLQTAFDATTVSYTYGFGQDAFGKTCFKTRVTDPNGKKTYKFTDGRGLNTSVTAPLNTITKFVYDPLGTLLMSYDPEDNTSTYEYDLLGRLISRNHPDAGITRYKYDLAGNVLATQTQNLANNSQEIQYDYAHCRLERIVYPQNPEMNVYYEYGAPNSGNQSSRLIRQQDASGVQIFAYGNMGELIKNIHTFVVPGGSHYTFETNWEYDSWNRMKRTDYPDGERVTYHYDNGGKLYSMDGDKYGQMYDYINAVFYNKYGSRTRIKYGNGTNAEYVYNPLNQRLSNMLSYENGGAVMQNINYSYDNASNITSVTNSSDYLNGHLGGDYGHEFKYDDLYRLTSGSGFFQSGIVGTIGYKQTMKYSASGNIVRKTLDASEEIGGGIQNIDYNRKYEYNDRPHTVTETGDYFYKWDANGNQICRGGQGDRLLCWDEENRLMAVNDMSERPTYSAYIYDAGGERAWKMASDVVSMYINGQGTNYAELVKTLYVNPYMVVTEKEYTKHYYIEGERVCTKIGGGFGHGPNIPVEGELHPLTGDYETMQKKLWEMTMQFVKCTDGPEIAIGEKLKPAHNGGDEVEKLQYFYHPDHLGSSSFITDATGYATQHLQYLPFGETFVDQQNGYDSRYTFSAKEKDDETQYSYFGARYYDSDLSVWLSVDPMSDKYPSLSPYAYCANNPVILVDPDGKAIKPANVEADLAINCLFRKYGGERVFGLTQIKSDGTNPNDFNNSYYSTSYSKSKFKKEYNSFAKSNNLSKQDKKNAMSLFKILSSEKVYEVGIATSNSTGQSNNYQVDTRNPTVATFIAAINASNNLSGSQTQNAINTLIPQGSPNGSNPDGQFGFFPDNNNTVITNTMVTSTTIDPRNPDRIVAPVAGILMVNPTTLNSSTFSASSGGRTQQDVDNSAVQAAINALAGSQ